MTRSIAINGHWWGTLLLQEVIITRVTAREVPYIVLEKTCSGTLPHWQFQQDLQPVRQ